MNPSFCSHSARPAGMSTPSLVVLLAFLVGLVWNPSAFAQPRFPATVAVDGLTTSVPDTFYGIPRALLGIASPLPYCDVNEDGQLDVADALEYRIRNRPFYRIIGTIRDELGHRYRQSSCTLRSSQVSRFMTSDSNGSFLFDDLPDGAYTLEVAGSTVREGTVWIPAIQKIPGLRPGDPAIDVFFDLGGAVSLKVVDGQGDPITRFKLDVQSEFALANPPPGIPSSIRDGYTSSCETLDGTVVVPHLIPGGNAEVIVTAASIGERKVSGIPVPLCGIGDTVIIQFQYEGRLEGRVLDEFGVPLSGIDVSAYFDFPRSTIARTTTHADGHYRFFNFPPGTVDLTLGSGNWVPQKLPDLVIEDNQTLHIPDVILQLGGTITGHVYRAGGSPASGVPLRCGPAVATTDATGSYRLEGAPPGDRQLIVSWQGSLDYAVESVVVVAGETVEVDVYLP